MRFRKKRHTRLFRSPSAFFPVTASAGTDYIFPRSFSTLASGDDVIEGRLFQAELSGAVLALEIIARHDVPPGERRRSPAGPEIPQKPDYGRRFYDERDRADAIAVFFDDFDFSKEKHADSMLPVDDLDRLESRIQE